MTTQLSTQQQTQDIERRWSVAWQEGFPVALWRLPRSAEKHLIIDLSGEVQRLKVDIEELPAGFVISPFLNPDGEQSRFLRADLYCKYDTNYQLLEESTNTAERLVELTDFQEKVQKDTPFVAPAWQEASGLVESSSTKQAYLSAVTAAVSAIEAGQFQKVVLSRTKVIQLSADFEVLAAFDKLCAAYPNAFVSVVSLPDEGSVWLGATPETLVSVDAQGLFRTVSLAGTQSLFDADGQPTPVSEARWTQKEIEEQALVSRYIIECFKKIRLREYIEVGPKTVIAGNLMHLRTDYIVDTEAVNFPQLGTVMLQLLHPTSAVCGTPKDPALAFILDHELHERSYYSGFIGPVNVQQASHLFVNLRTMQIADGQATLYAGAGITEDSLPEKEWHETEMKCQTLLRVIG